MSTFITVMASAVLFYGSVLIPTSNNAPMYIAFLFQAAWVAALIVASVFYVSARISLHIVRKARK